MADKLDAIVVETGPDPEACVIWLHGLGADGHDFEPFAYQLKLPAAIRYVFPHAPIQPVTINGGLRMRAWYDIVSPNLWQQVDKAGIRRSQGLVTALIEEQIASDIAPGRILVGGFSQGGVIALETGIRSDPLIAGIVVLSGYVALPDELPEAPASAPPILMLHGRDDSIVPLSLAEQSQVRLVSKGYQVSGQTFPVGHSVSPEEIVVLRRWLWERLNQSKD
ncbi:MAG: alpha/beta hydrolase [Methylohalobius sp.]|nr:alpha/beta hydrolase [Methylohalobius sp.]